MNDFVFDVAKFRAMFPAYADAAKYTDDYIAAKWDIAHCLLLSRGACSHCTTADCVAMIAYHLTAHLIALDDRMNAAGGSPGGIAGALQSASIDKISVTLAAPPPGDEWAWWLNQTAYGALLNTLLAGCGTPYMYVGGSRERSAFRKVGGRF